MSTDDPNPSLLERILAYATAAILLVAILSFFATLIVGLNDSEALGDGLWSFVYGVSMFGLPLGFVLLMILLIVAQRRRSREAKQSDRGGRRNRTKS